MQDEISPNFSIGGLQVYGDAILAPMDGYSDLPFRSLARQLGSAMSYTQFVSAKSLLIGRREVERYLAYEESERPVVFQLYGDDPARLLQAALALRQRNPDMIDLNLGCSSKAVVARGAGAGLLRRPKRIAEIMQILTKALDIPVSAKIRIGWDEDQRNYLQVARIIANNGGALLAVHARTQAQAYGGRADWDTIAEIKTSLDIPVIGNGDVRTVADIQKMKAYTGCDAVMIGRAAIGNPWLFAGLDRHQVSTQQVRRVMLQHLESMQRFYGREDGLVRFRKHAKRYISPYPLPVALRRQLLTSTTRQEFISVLEQVISLEPA